MNKLLPMLMCATLASAAVGSSQASTTTNIIVDDAYVRSNQSRTDWHIGTGSVNADYLIKNGEFLITGLGNRALGSDFNYIDRANAICPLDSLVSLKSSRFVIKELWTKYLLLGTTANPSADDLKISVKKGDMLGFSVGAHGSLIGDQIDWPTTVTYADGENYTSSTESKVDQGPVWFYYVRSSADQMILMDEIAYSENAKQSIRLPSSGSGFRAGAFEPHVGPNVMHPSNDCDAIRVWKAPKDGTVSIAGAAKHIGDGDVDIAVLSIRKKTEEIAAPNQRQWQLENARGTKVTAGGRPAVQLDLTLKSADIRVRYHIVAYPRTSVLRQWFELENVGKQPINLTDNGTLMSLRLQTDGDDFDNCWLIGGNRESNEGQLLREHIDPQYHHDIMGSATFEYIPWTAILRSNRGHDGFYIMPDYLGKWRISVARNGANSVGITAACNDLSGISLAPGKIYRMPYLTFGTMNSGLDDMARNIYNWQYDYMWDYTHDDWYTKMPFTVAWYGDSDNAQQQFTGHLADLDMNWADKLRSVGMEILWEDAGWSASRKWFDANFEGPDFAQTRRFLDKNDMKLAVWIAGHQSSGLLGTKVAAWGNFQRRTDGLEFDPKIDRSFRTDTEGFLNSHPRCSFQTCSCGSTYAHIFEAQRYSDINYDSDPPGGNYTNAYWSYLDTPDKWFDNLNCWGVYNNNTGMRYLTQVPKWGIYLNQEDVPSLRRICDIYHYLLKTGVAGRWSHIVHPPIKGDDERHYCQRVSYDGKRSIIIIKHQSTGTVTIYPRGLQLKVKYLVDYEVSKDSVTRTGADLMKNGIVIVDQKLGELIYLNLPNRPGSLRDKNAPMAPSNVLMKRETNIGYSGIGIYWAPGSDNNWISYYEIKRNNDIIGTVCTGLYYFDRSEGWNPNATYYVRTVDGDGNRSKWTTAKLLDNELLSSCALGGLFAQSGRDGWSAEIATKDGKYVPMTWIPPAARPGIDAGGTTIQRGGAEGYWEGANTARVGRGWQQASTEADCVRTWKAPVDGSIRIAGRAVKEFYHRDAGAPLSVCIRINDKQVWPQTGLATVELGSDTGVAHNLTLQVTRGDLVRFVVKSGTSPENDIVAWMPSITYTGSYGSPAKQSVIRIRCGAKRAYVDNNGVLWSADKFFRGGRVMSFAAGLQKGLQLIDDPNLYKSGRTGENFTYSIPVNSGLYCIRLKFAETKYKYFFQRPFNVYVNGRQVMSNFDICQAARGPKRAYDRLIRYVVPNGEGRIDLRFACGWEPSQATKEALIQAIEITPEFKPVVRINAGSDTEFIDWNSFVWGADCNFVGGKIIRSENKVEYASPTLYDQQLYRGARSGKSFAYKIAVPDGLYNVHLKFAELWLKDAGKRPMNIEINGKLVRKNWDPLACAGKPNMSADLRMDDVVPNGNGQIIIHITATGENDAILQGIEIE